MKCFVLFELQTLCLGKTVHLYQIEIGVSGGRRRGQRRERASVRRDRHEAKAPASLRKKHSGQAGSRCWSRRQRHWSGSGLGSTFSPIHHAVLEHEMQNVVCVHAPCPVEGIAVAAKSSTTSKAELQRLKPHRPWNSNVVAEATTHKDQFVSTNELSPPSLLLFLVDVFGLFVEVGGIVFE